MGLAVKRMGRNGDSGGCGGRPTDRPVGRSYRHTDSHGTKPLPSLAMLGERHACLRPTHEEQGRSTSKGELRKRQVRGAERNDNDVEGTARSTSIGRAVGPRGRDKKEAESVPDSTAAIAATTAAAVEDTNS